MQIKPALRKALEDLKKCMAIFKFILNLLQNKTGKGDAWKFSRLDGPKHRFPLEIKVKLFHTESPCPWVGTHEAGKY